MAKTVKKGANSKASTKAKTSGPELEENEQNPELLKVNEVKLQGVQFAGEVEMSSDEDSLGIMSAGYAPLDKAGYVIEAMFLGTKRIFSEKLRNSKAVKFAKFNGEEHPYRDCVEFRNSIGQTFAIFLTGKLAALTRCLPYNTPVRLTYLGEDLVDAGKYADGEAKEHKFKLEVTKEAQAIMEKNKYQPDRHNWLNNPAAPRAKSTTTDKTMAGQNNYIRAILAGQVSASIDEMKKLGIDPAVVAGNQASAQAQITQ